ncbi:GlxA family transcriptional regulator [Laribacter hongkongensis]|uniref:GlxA family transcriptional regulator n=1 Tax=Laribacter hongkongensis TaxID=168471 RepID=UPI001EFEEFF6|nr:GlxA family transcriptional regulator [Laribacter hongkongensis]MCG8991272.1 GlxA family transcriptional regulator [Laribacter hongkongensis]MCG8997619.1 GlxA family transcriptional regulator [Laribacter hongkongensis]MCG8999985.1 GlxA family transcriptional regulator [Laribacter hongkongensis]MCG9003726.1 GlxA family transcriptional regulator [Laribacter hongkongensis]MCG9007960.1 GlxA family transcriptional regulator [Laribacter hongkongensis]
MPIPLRKRLHADSAPPTLRRYGFLLLPRFSLSSYALAMDVLAAANDRAERKLYDTLTLSLDGGRVRAANGIDLAADLAPEFAPKLDGIFVFADDLNVDFDSDLLAQQLIPFAQEGCLIAGMETASFLLARIGLLSGYRATIHWEEMARFSEAFDDVIVSSNLFEIDRQRASCAGGAATLDFMLTLIGQQHGNEFAAEISERFSLERIRPGSERQRIPLATRIGGSQPKLTEAVSLMEANIEEPLSTDDIAFYVGVSRRQLERLFKQYLNTVPSRYYLELRLNRARQLLQQTSKSIVQIGLSCGFSSGPHFSSTYRNHFGITPREERAQRALPARHGEA